MKKFNLLIADDSQEFRAQIAAYFRGTEQVNIIAEAGNGVEALECLEQFEPDVLILDLVMPELDGFGVLKHMKASGKRKPYTVVVSQLHTDICINKAIADGADFYLLKPLNMASLHEHLLLLGSQEHRQAQLPRTREAETSVHAAATTMGYISRNNKNPLDERIANIFLQVGIPPHIKGYQFLREAIKLAVETPEIINSITKKLYPAIANSFATSSSKVERAIRHAIEVACNRGKMENLNQILKMKVYTPNDKPTNGEFIALIADRMLLEGA